MSSLKERVNNFLAQKRIAVAGVSRKSQGTAANLIYQKLREKGYQVYAINPHATTVEGDPCYPDLRNLPEKVDAVLISTTPAVSEEIVKQCAELGIAHVWMHRSFGEGSVSKEATRFCKEHNILVIPGACPMMYCEPVDFGHKCMRWALGIFGKLPQ